MLTEKTLETKITTAITSALSAVSPALPSYKVTGFWQSNAVGVLKGLESDPSQVAIVEVATGLGEQPTFSDPNVNFSVNVNLAVRVELDDDALANFAEPISNLFKSWMAATYQQTFTALDISGVLSIDDVSVSGGVPTINADDMISSIAWTLTLSGSYPISSTNNSSTNEEA